MSKDIVLLKLTTGEEIVALVKEENSHHFVVEKPRTMLIQPNDQGQMTVGLIPWSVGSPDGEFELYKDKIAGRAKSIPKQFEDGYLSQTSGIQIATGG